MKKFAIIGCGDVAGQHAENISRIGTLVAVCDNVQQKADAFANLYPVNKYSSVDDLLAMEKNVDAVVVCTPNGLHAEHIIKSLQAGKDVLAEGPLCLTKAAAWQIIETEKFCRQKLFLIQTARYYPVVRQLKNLLDEKTLGDVYNFQLRCTGKIAEEYFSGWRGKDFPGGGLLYTPFVPYLDALTFLFGEVKEAKGFSKNNSSNAFIEFESSGAAALQMQNGVLGTLDWSVAAAQKSTEATLTIATAKGLVRVGGETLNNVETGTSFFSPGYENKPANLYEAMYNDLEKNDAFFPNVFDGAKTVEAIEKIYKAVR
jgi:UDP-N-acetyl-2-amino-2-deoxyglucuronate dehydrogenase